MCGIVGAIGDSNCIENVYNGLKKLEYRGYDSSGIAALDGDHISLIKSQGKLASLEPLLASLPKSSSICMGHTRWATHGVPSTRNAHPHREAGNAIVHNGILENYQELKNSLLEKGTQFSSDTDTEVIVHLLHQEMQFVSDVRKALLNLVGRFEGAYALGVMSAHDPDAIWLIKQGSPIAIGCGDGANYFASDALPLVKHTNRVLFLEDGEIARIAKNEISLWNFQGAEVKREAQTLDWDASASEKGGYRHYMLKEIHEQPSVMRQMIGRLTQPSDMVFDFDALGISELNLDQIGSVKMIGCGTSFYAAQLGSHLLEPIIQKPISVELASEFRYRQPFLDERTLVVAFTQSGETADTLACVKHAREAGCQVLSVCNVRYSSIPRYSTSTLYMETGPEIGVASTKAFTAMVLSIYLWGLGLRQKIHGESAQLENLFEHLRKIPGLIDQALKSDHHIQDIVNHYHDASSFLFIGRGASFPIGMEGALKLKEISYIHAEGYAGGELKHGPIALIDRSMPVMAVVPNDSQKEKMLSNIEEIRAREGRVIAVGDESCSRLQHLCEQVIPCPQIENESLQAIASVVSLQLFSYYMAVQRGTDVDQPRNLAKSVTVE